MNASKQCCALGKIMKQDRKAIFDNSVCFSFNVYNFLSLQPTKQSFNFTGYEPKNLSSLTRIATA